MIPAVELEGVDQDRLVVAAHELGHAITFRAVGPVELQEIRVKGKGTNAHGWVLPRTKKGTALNDEQARLYLAASYAGRAADLRWCEIYGLRPYSESTCSEDKRIAKQQRREWQAKWSTGELRAEAARFVRAHWRDIERRVVTLAKRGSISL